MRNFARGGIARVVLCAAVAIGVVASFAIAAFWATGDSQSSFALAFGGDTVVRITAITPGANIRTIIPFANNLGVGVRILAVETSCGCLRATADSDVLERGAEGKLAVTIRGTSVPGINRQVVALKFCDADRPHVIGQHLVTVEAFTPGLQTGTQNVWLYRGKGKHQTGVNVYAMGFDPGELVVSPQSDIAVETQASPWRALSEDECKEMGTRMPTSVALLTVWSRELAAPNGDRKPTVVHLSTARVDGVFKAQLEVRWISGADVKATPARFVVAGLLPGRSWRGRVAVEIADMDPEVSRRLAEARVEASHPAIQARLELEGNGGEIHILVDELALQPGHAVSGVVSLVSNRQALVSIPVSLSVLVE